ncbi:hypothetical protein CASFOL_039848 [Castilleja foliolosa]|uniref:TF-B3 domain-containing protein n=1 Tax=Castilleja foliolosa TaxID=1961234 RepID=A0ABD3BGW7_9LAMI
MAAPKFFKIILDPKTDSLKIPPEFTKRYGRNLPNHVLLKVPTGSSMVVELVPSDGKTLILQKGWREFRERYSIGFGHFLVFEYNWKSEFNVSIFDKAGVEINYVHAEYKTGEKRKIIKTENQENTTQALQSEKNGVILALEGNFQTRVEMQSEVVSKKTSIAYQRAATFASAHIKPKKNPFHICIMHHSHVHGFKLDVPFSFARESLLCIGENSVSMVMNGKRWPVRCLVRNTRAFLSSGWGRFVKDNGIKIGDVCIFEEAERIIPPQWNVVVFPS